MSDFNEKHIGSNFEDFLQEEGIFEETTAIAIKRVLSWQIAQAMKEQNLTKTAMADKISYKKHNNRWQKSPSEYMRGL